MNLIKWILIKRIKLARKSINYTQDKLANKLNTTHSVISAYESGKTAMPPLFMIEITKKSLNWFLDKIWCLILRIMCYNHFTD